MKLSGDVRGLAAVMSVLSKVVPGKVTVPVLQACRVSADGGVPEFVATDLDVVARLRPGTLSVEGEGVAALPVRYLGDLCRHLEGGFELEVDAQAAELRCGRGKYQLNVVDPDSFPEVKSPAAGVTVEFDFIDLCRMQVRAGFACATDVSRPALTGVLWEAGPEGLTVVSTDGTRMCVWEKSGQVFPEIRRVVVPARAFEVVSRMPKPEADKATVVLEERYVWFGASSWTVGSRLLASPYPEWRQVVPREFVATFEADLAAFRSALERVALVGEAGEIRPVRLALRPGVVEMEASSASVGRGREEVDAEVQGVSLEIRFNAGLLGEGLRALEGERVKGQFVGPQQASVFSDPADPGYRYLALPLRD